MKKENEDKGILKSSFFFKLYVIPSITLVVISLFAMIPDETEIDPLTWSELITADIFLLVVWFIISFVITLIVNKVRKSKTKSINKVNCETKIDEKITIKKEETNLKHNKPSKKADVKYPYTCKTLLNSYEYVKMIKYFPQVYWNYVKVGTIINTIFFPISAIYNKSYSKALLVFVIIQIFIMVLYKLKLDFFAKRNFNFYQKRGKIDNEVQIDFYENNFIVQGKLKTITVDYSEIIRSIETETNFYLQLNNKKVLIIQKNQCDLELIDFIRSTFENLENHLGDNSNFKGVGKDYNHNKIRTLMIILFVITIASLWGALWSVNLVNKIHPQYGYNFTKNTWAFWCWLPVPILSIVLGFKYKKKGIKCTKNIVGGFIIAFLLIIYGSFSLLPTFAQDYDMIDKYKNIINADLPSNGELEIINRVTTLDEDKTNYSIINAYYDKEDVKNLEKSIVDNENWILSKEIKSELKIFIPSNLYSDFDAYFSIYNSITNEYNTLPEESGNYVIYAMKYDKSDKHLEIHKFDYYYKK